MTLTAQTDEKAGRDGEPWELEPIPTHIVRAKPGQPGHDDKLNEETRRRRHRSRFEQYGYKRLDARQINALEWYSGLCEIVSRGTLSHTRYGDEAGTIDCVVYGERSVTDRVMDAARARRRCVKSLSRTGNKALKALHLAVYDDMTPREIGELLIAKSGLLMSKNRQMRDAETIGVAMYLLTEALNVVDNILRR